MIKTQGETTTGRAVTRLLGAAAIGAVAVTGFAVTDAAIGTPAAHAADGTDTLEHSSGGWFGAEFGEAYVDSGKSGAEGMNAAARAVSEAHGGVPVAWVESGSLRSVSGSSQVEYLNADGTDYQVYVFESGEGRIEVTGNDSTHGASATTVEDLGGGAYRLDQSSGFGSQGATGGSSSGW